MIITEGMVGFVLLIVGALFGAFWRIWGLIREASGKGEQAQTDLAAHKLHVAETYVSKQGHREATDQVMEAIGAVKTAVEGTNLRIDRMWESHGKPTPRARQ
ncbi:conserved protein of unknown function [Aminobacter niigataensis]|nr:conserved protein of unknown function [Aminobacter niigataensis]